MKRRADPDPGNSFLHPRLHTCPVCGGMFKMPWTLQARMFRCACGTRISLSPGWHRQRIAGWQGPLEAPNRSS